MFSWRALTRCKSKLYFCQYRIDEYALLTVTAMDIHRSIVRVSTVDVQDGFRREDRSTNLVSRESWKGFCQPAESRRWRLCAGEGGVKEHLSRCWFKSRSIGRKVRPSSGCFVRFLSSSQILDSVPFLIQMV